MHHLLTHTYTQTAFYPILDTGLKRSSPIVHHHRPSKLRHYSEMNDSLLSPDSQQRSGRQSTNMELMSPEINSMIPEDRQLIRTKQEDG